MKVVEETRTFEMSLEDSMGFETIEDMLNVQNTTMLSAGWTLKRFEARNDGQTYHATYYKFHWS